MSLLRPLPLLIALLLLLAGCTWVPLEPEAEGVRVATADEVADCERVGHTIVSLRDRIAGVQRSPEKVQEELQRLARNSAPELGGDTVVAVDEPEGGKQTFLVYRCRR